MKKEVWLILAGIFLTLNGMAQEMKNAGKLFIIGGGKRPAAMIERLVKESGVDKDGYIAVLPMSSELPDTAYYYTRRQFLEQGIESVFNFYFPKGIPPAPSQIDSLKNAGMIYIPGGSQTKFMETVIGSEIYDAIHTAYSNGATIAGTSAGAAVISKKMITGDERKHPEYTGDFRTIEADNIIIEEGLGLLENAIIDQHFIWRMRMNRLMTAAIEHPDETCIGIDESTALLVKGNRAEVIGNYQVVVIKNPNSRINSKNGLLGAENLQLSIYLPGETFLIGKE
jgi:cyanophycinase